MTVNAYDLEVWFLLKEIWCAVPKITWPALIKLVAEATGKATPSADHVRKKSKAEKWKKKIRAYCRKADSTLSNVKHRLLEDLKKEYEKLQRDIDETAQVTNGMLVPKSGGMNFTFDMLKNVAYQNRKTVTVIQEHRQRTGKIGQLLDASMDWMYQAKEAALDPDKTPEELQTAQKQFGLLEAMVEKIESFSRTAKNLIQSDFLLFGITEDNTRDSDSEDRVSEIQNDSVFDKARDELAQQYIEMQQKVEWIQSGGFESEVAKQIEEQLRKESEDDEFFEDDDDE